MNKKSILGFYALLVAALIGIAATFFNSHKIALLNPQGWVAKEEYHLMLVAVLLMLSVVIPVFILTFRIIWKYRSDNPKAKYDPEWNDSKLAETVWWGLPFFIILLLSYITWVSSHKLDPFKPLESEKQPLKIQVVALQWKWLFIYPEEQIATVNFFQFPEKTPINFEISADAPMNSFWIPQLGGQIYAMPGMSTKLHLIADKAGEYRGSSANLSGEGFAGMHFIAKASSDEDFKKWVEEVKKSDKSLDKASFDELAKPSEYNAPTYYTLGDKDLYSWIVMKPMMPTYTPRTHITELEER